MKKKNGISIIRGGVDEGVLFHHFHQSMMEIASIFFLHPPFSVSAVKYLKSIYQNLNLAREDIVGIFTCSDDLYVLLLVSAGSQWSVCVAWHQSLASSHQGSEPYVCHVNSSLITLKPGTS